MLDITLAAISLVFGFLFGYLSERRQLKYARAESAELKTINRKLQKQLAEMHNVVDTLDLNVRSSVANTPSSSTISASTEIDKYVFEIARSLQDPSGIVTRSRLINRLIHQYSYSEIDTAINDLIEQGRMVVENDNLLKIRD